MTSMAACAMFTSQAFAQDAAPADSGAQDKPEVVVVTGTRIRRPNLTSTSPITTLDKKELEYQGVLNLEEALNRLPQVRANSTQFTNGSDSDGRAKINLRNLGWQRSLVLLDGQRLLPVQAIDLNIVPTALVKRVDVLTGGASATYGSDAIAGVVNFVLNKEFNGIEINGSVGGYQHTNDASDIQALIKNVPSINLPKKNVFDGQRTDINIAAGKNFADGRGNISIFLDQRHQDAVTWSQRDYSSCRILQTGLCSVNTSYSPYGRYTFNDRPPEVATYYGAMDGSNTFVRGSDAYGINTREKFNFLRSDDRFTGGIFGHYKFNEHAEVHGTFLYMKDESSSQFYPALMSETVDLNCNNPYLSAAQAQTMCGASAGTSATVSTTVNYQLDGPGSKELDNKATNQDYRYTFGVRGDIADGWSYDVGFVGSRVETTLSDNNNVDPQSFRNAIQVVNVNGTATCLVNADAITTNDDPKCVPANIFSYHTVDPKFYDYAYRNYSWGSVTQQQTYTANINGDLTQYGVQSPWAKDGVALAAGLEYRRDSLRNEVDAATKEYEGWPSTVSGHYGVKEFYGELQIPLVSDKPFVYSLDFNTAFRQSKYDNLDKALGTSKFELQYRPIKDLLVRATFNNAQRAPNISELFSGKTLSINGSLEDGCGTSKKHTAAECANTGVTAAQYGTMRECTTGSCWTFAGGGNPLLRPEEAETLTYGLVYTPHQVPGLMVSVDYYDILINDYINYLDAVDNYSKCLTTGLDYYCQYIHRGTDGSFTQAGGGYVEGGTLNTYRLHNRGLDLQAAYNFDLGKYGRVDTNFMATALSITGGQDSPITASVNCTGYFGQPNCYAPQPKWRHNLRATWQTPWYQSSVSVNWRRIGSTTLSGNSSDPAVSNGGGYTNTIFTKLPDYDYIDMSGSVRLRQNLTLNLSVNNLFDLTPPITYSQNVDGTSNNPNTWTGTYDPLGRSILLSFKLKL
ncbi:TonB-dependent receptor domain-containing protein [Asticcacaulis sp. MM231]|uniref:TonB-dependent receptor domain-containing protein n=1 Tax=Asticcacaulis sp. MM231 TaxID=3157666 RepID=UPI0032D56F0A